MGRNEWWTVFFVGFLVGCSGGTSGDDAGQGSDASGASCAGASDGTSCGTGKICLSGSCSMSRCGDGFVDTSRGEACDDGNQVAHDGCEPGTCQFTCSSASDCDDGAPCNGAEQCTAAHECASGTAPPDGTACTLSGGGAGVCHGGSCAMASCGDGIVEAGEHCDDGNDVNGDGCESDCRFTCEVDSSATNTWYLDCDGDGYAADGAPTQMVCLSPSPMSSCTGGWTLLAPTTGSSDCDDTDAAVHPGVTETCDGVDQDCDGMVDEGVKSTFYRDTDGDTYGNDASTTMACSAPPGYVDRGGDCDDGDSAAFPGQTMFFTRPRTGGGYDFNCDGTVTEQYRTLSPSSCSTCVCMTGFCCAGMCPGWVGSVPSCGSSGTWRQTACDCTFPSSSRTQGCN